MSSLQIPRVSSNLSQFSESSVNTEDESMSIAASDITYSDSDDILTNSETDETASNTDSGKRVILVTGGAGFIGSATAAVLLGRGDDVVIIDGAHKREL